MANEARASPPHRNGIQVLNSLGVCDVCADGVGWREMPAEMAKAYATQFKKSIGNIRNRAIAATVLIKLVFGTTWFLS